MADTNTNILQTLKIDGKHFSIACWEQLGLTKEYMIALLSRDEYTPVANQQPTDAHTLYTDPVSGNPAGFHPGQCVIYPDSDIPDGWGLSIAKNVTTTPQGVPIKISWYHATDVEKRLTRLEEKMTITHDGVIGTGLWINEYPWQQDAVWDNGN